MGGERVERTKEGANDRIFWADVSGLNMRNDFGGESAECFVKNSFGVSSSEEVEEVEGMARAAGVAGEGLARSFSSACKIMLAEERKREQETWR